MYERKTFTYVKATAPFALIHASRIWSSVAPRRFPAALTGLSTGPPGRWVTGLKVVFSAPRSFERMHETPAYMRGL